jgi:uncharacterized membrane protein YfcA
VSLFLLTALVAAGAFGAGLIGALTGLGGGVVLVPLLTIAFGVDIRYAAGASLVSVIATSSGAAAAFLREGFSNIRIAMFLEIATTAGALVGAHAAARVSTSTISIVLGGVLIAAAALSWLSPDAAPRPDLPPPDRLTGRLRLDGELPAPEGPRRYQARRAPLGFALMFVAGGLSGLLGIGSGAVKVLAMDRAMRLPFKVSAATSNFMIGVTAAASAGVYLGRGYVDPGLAAPVMLGVVAGSFVGARILVGAGVRRLRVVFAIVIAVLGIEMVRDGLMRAHR